MDHPTAPPHAARHAPLRALIRQVAAATDSQMLRILATVETAADRREADTLLSPLRPRLNVLRPPRRLRLRRLMFYPLDPLILPPRRWRPGMPAIPRSILGPLGEAMAAAIPQTMERVAAMTAGQTTADKDLIRAAGALLWPAAAAALDDAARPHAWRDTGLAVSHFHTLAPVMATLLRQAAAVETLVLTALPGLLPPAADAVHAILRAVADERPVALPSLFVMLMMRLPDPAVLFALPRGDTLTPTLAAARTEATGFLLDRMRHEGPGTWIAGGPLTEAAETVRRLISLLQHAERRGGPAVRPQCLVLRQAIDQACRARFDTVLRTDTLPALTAATPDPAALEDSVLGLVLFQAEARAAGGRQAYDAALATLAEAIATHTTGILAARLTELLLGPEAALARLS